MVSEISGIDHVITESEIDALLLEANLIRKLLPKYNVNWKDGKSYPLIEISIKDPVPKVRAVRRETNPKARYFGPYPTGSDLSSLLRFLRPIFPFVSENHPGNRPCLRSHLGLCPCPNVFTGKQAQKKYRSALAQLILFLQGQRQEIQHSLTKEMAKEADKENFEKANEIKKRLQQLSLITARRTRPWEYESNPNLIADRRAQELSDLKRLLKLPKLQKIECFDISNTAGKLATGSQVTFVEGIPDKALYRHYRIKRSGVQNDVAMIREVLTRRLESSISLPDLVILDGGKGQLTAARSALAKSSVSKSGKNLPFLIALAKRRETIYSLNLPPINLPLGSPALSLVQRLRDEAHRFSRRYHFWLRDKKMLA